MSSNFFDLKQPDSGKKGKKKALQRDANDCRMQLQQQLLDEAMLLLKRKCQVPLITSDQETEESDCKLRVHLQWESTGTALTICEAKVRGLPPQRFIELFKDHVAVLPTFNKKVRLRHLEWDGDFQVVHQRYKMPCLLYNRSFFNTYYHIDGEEPGEYQFIVSGQGNEKFANKHARVAGKDVIGRIDLNLIAVRPLRNKEYDIIGTFIQ